jgi:hypothetical protein
MPLQHALALPIRAARHRSSVDVRLPLDVPIYPLRAMFLMCHARRFHVSHALLHAIGSLGLELFAPTEWRM